MLKICPVCRRTFSGGRLCLHCTGVALLDVAEPAVRRAHLRDGELRSTIRTYYMARSAMILLFGGILGGLAACALLVRQAAFATGPARSMWAALAIAALAAVPLLAVACGTRVVRRLTRTCRGRPIQIRDVRIVRTGAAAGGP